MFAICLQDSDNALIVGKPSRNAPNAYGDVKEIILPQSGIALYISGKQFLRPDQNRSHSTLEPDLVCEPDGELESVLKIFSTQSPDA